MLRSYFKEHRNVVAEILKAETQKEWTAEDVGILEEDIFVNHDVFFDAVIYWGDKYGNILSMDFITPHQSSLKNPIPIRILKINPGVKLEFRFQLYDHIVENNARKSKSSESNPGFRIRYKSLPIRYIAFDDARIPGLDKALNNLLHINFESTDIMVSNSKAMVQCTVDICIEQCSVSSSVQSSLYSFSAEMIRLWIVCIIDRNCIVADVLLFVLP